MCGALPPLSSYAVIAWFLWTGTSFMQCGVLVLSVRSWFFCKIWTSVPVINAELRVVPLVDVRTPQSRGGLWPFPLWFACVYKSVSSLESFLVVGYPWPRLAANRRWWTEQAEFTSLALNGGMGIVLLTVQSFPAKFRGTVAAGSHYCSTFRTRSFQCSSEVYSNIGQGFPVRGHRCILWGPDTALYYFFVLYCEEIVTLSIKWLVLSDI